MLVDGQLSIEILRWGIPYRLQMEAQPEKSDTNIKVERSKERQLRSHRKWGQLNENSDEQRR